MPSAFLNFSRFTLILAAFLALGSTVVCAATAKKAKKSEKTESAATYKGAIVMDADTGKVLFEDHADEVTPPASMTKLMTFAVLYDKLLAGTLQISAPVTITAEESQIGGTQVYLKEGEVFSVEELIYAMMIQSANDAAFTLAVHSAGSQEAFVALMNAKAKELGMARTVFKTAHGLPPESRKIAEGDLTTPRDFALLCDYLLKNTDVLKYTSIKTRPFGEGVREKKRVMQMTNHNHLLGKVAGVDGFKTGYTKGAGFCLSTTAERNGRRIIVVTMGTPERKVRDKKITELLEKGFAELAQLPVAVAKGAVASTEAGAASRIEGKTSGKASAKPIAGLVPGTSPELIKSKEKNAPGVAATLSK